MKAWVHSSLCPGNQYPILAVNGEHGSGTTGLSKTLRALVDPNQAGLRSAPRDERDLMIAATNSWIIRYDNLFVIPSALSESLCRLSTGGGFATRELFTDGEEKLFNATRPILLNGIRELGTRPDLLSRIVSVSLPTIPRGRRKPEGELLPAFGLARPRILGAFLSAVAVALGNRPSVSLPDPGRMADFELSGKMLNQYLDTVRAFCNWCVSPMKRMRDNPLAHIEKVDEEPVRHRRSYTIEAIYRLLAAVPAERRIVYLTAIATGLRRPELEDLQIGDLRLNATTPFIKLRGKATKARRSDSIAIKGGGGRRAKEVGRRRRA